MNIGVNAQQNYDIKPLSSEVNSEFAELSPIISADGKTLYFVRSAHPENLNGSGSQEIWVSKKDSLGQWQKAEHMGKALNRQVSNVLYNCGSNSNRLIISGSYKKGVYWGVGLSFIEFKNGVWGEPYELDIKGFDDLNRGAFTSASLLNDNKTLILAFSEEEDSKSCDLYVSQLQKNGTWNEPKFLRKLNSKYDESTPFMAADGVTLYFSSNRPGGYGQNDIYLTRRLDETWLNWSDPINLGPQINTEQWDGYYTIPASGNMAYMVSYQNPTTKADIVQVELSKQVKPEPVALITGKALNAKTGLPVEAQIIYEELPSGTERGKISFWSASGDYKIVLPYGKNYGITAKAAGYIPVAINVDLSKPGEYIELVKNLQLVPIETGQVVRLNNIFFDEYSDKLKDESLPELMRLVKLLKENQSLTIEIAGHTDAVGSDDENQLLSEKRANAVKAFLIEKGIKANRIFGIGYGESQPVADNNNDVDRQLNRRVEFKILKK
jgi:outer membrane protein OmpA-like peptidoglycan-associated protein